MALDRRKRAALAAALMLLIALPGCGRSGGQGSENGPFALSGHVKAIGGPGPGESPRLEGEVELQDTEGDVVATTTLKSGAFTFTVKAGTYVLVYPGTPGCRADVTVAKDVVFDLRCQIK